MEQIFTLPDNWTGGFYELAVVLEDPSQDNLQKALKVLWTHPALDGCYKENTKEPSHQERLDPNISQLPVEGHVYGVAHLPNSVKVACESTIIAYIDNGSTWLYFGIPMEALGHAYPVGAFPFEDGTPLDWRVEVDAWFLGIGEKLFREGCFQIGTIGFELPEEDAEAFRKNGIPEQRWEGYLWQEGDQLKWYPPNQRAPMQIERKKWWQPPWGLNKKRQE